MGDLTRDVAGASTPGSGWSPGLTSAGYLTKVWHFYPKGETRSVCEGNFRRSRAPKPQQQLPQSTEYHARCQQWVKDHPNGGRKHKSKGRAK